MGQSNKHGELAGGQRHMGDPRDMHTSAEVTLRVHSLAARPDPLDSVLGPIDKALQSRSDPLS